MCYNETHLSPEGKTIDRSRQRPVKTLPIGCVATLRVARLTPHGPVLATPEGPEVLLPARYADPSCQTGDAMAVFLYTDSEDRPVATTQRPVALLGETATMRVVDVTPAGAFVDWGLPKDLFVPKSQQLRPMKKEETRIIMVALDTQTGRLFGTERFERRLQKAKPKDLKRNQAVEVLLFKKTELGYKAVVNRRFEGLLYHTDIFTPVQTGQSFTAYVRFVRPDGKIDLLSRPIGKRADKASQNDLLEALRRHGGSLPLHYKSDPEAIKTLLGMSKKHFKKALTQLLERGLIEVSAQRGQTRLIPKRAKR